MFFCVYIDVSVLQSLNAHPSAGQGREAARVLCGTTLSYFVDLHPHFVQFGLVFIVERIVFQVFPSLSHDLQSTTPNLC